MQRDKHTQIHPAHKHPHVTHICKTSSYGGGGSGAEMEALHSRSLASVPAGWMGHRTRHNYLIILRL